MGSVDEGTGIDAQSVNRNANLFSIIVPGQQSGIVIILITSDNNRVTGLHNSYPRIITSSQFGSNEYVF